MVRSHHLGTIMLLLTTFVGEGGSVTWVCADIDCGAFAGIIPYAAFNVGYPVSSVLSSMSPSVSVGIFCSVKKKNNK